jgi:hypothetical protein
MKNAEHPRDGSDTIGNTGAEREFNDAALLNRIPYKVAREMKNTSVL